MLELIADQVQQYRLSLRSFSDSHGECVLAGASEDGSEYSVVCFDTTSIWIGGSTRLCRIRERSGRIEFFEGEDRVVLACLSAGIVQSSYAHWSVEAYGSTLGEVRTVDATKVTSASIVSVSKQANAVFDVVFWVFFGASGVFWITHGTTELCIDAIAIDRVRAAHLDPDKRALTLLDNDCRIACNYETIVACRTIRCCTPAESETASIRSA
jgi:hypothetical protein